MSDLSERLADVERNIVINDAVALIDNEVASKRGVSGVLLKGGYKVVKKLKSGRMISFAVDKLLDDFAKALDPIYEEFSASSDATFEMFIVERKDESANALLAITDSRAERADSKVIKKTYKKLRGTAKSHVVDALPGVGRLIDKHAPRIEE